MQYDVFISLSMVKNRIKRVNLLISHNFRYNIRSIRAKLLFRPIEKESK